MLEKTAASLDPCSLQRVLPAATKTLRSRRQLHTTFWQHGAAEVEISTAWQAMMHGVLDSNSMTETSDGRTSPLRASSFLLDFLYPTATLAFLRPFSERLDVYRSGQSFARVSPRLYTSGPPPPPKPRSGDEDERKSEQGPDQDEFADAPNTTAQAETPAPASLETSTFPENAAPLDDEESATSQFEEEQVERLEEAHSQDGPGAELEKMLSSGDVELTDEVWRHYNALDDMSKDLYVGEVVKFLSKANRLSSSMKISEILQTLDSTQMNSALFTAGVSAEMNLQNQRQAEEMFVKGLVNPRIGESSLLGVFDRFLASALKSKDIGTIKKIWTHYDAMSNRWSFDGITSRLRHVASVPKLADKVLSLRQFLEKRSMEPGYPELRKLLVRRALMSCTDSEVTPLLSMAGDNLAFEEFLRNIVSTDRRNLIANVYELYRKQSEAKPSHAVLHVAFNAYVGMTLAVHKMKGVELIRKDWDKFHAGLSRRAYQKFMGFYASLGNKKEVYKLWTEYVRLHSEHVTQNGTRISVFDSDDTFSHLLHVHAVRREVNEVQNIFDDISAKFGLKPNRASWNILLNAYVRAGDYNGAINSFDKISKEIGADIYTYSTLMRMAAHRGDLGFTVELYRHARRQKLRTDNVSMLVSLVNAYCQNDHFNEAENVCTRAAKKGIKDPNLWNSVIHAYALRRNLSSINRVLSMMSDLKIDYDSHTYRHLLIGLALCRQAHHALHLLSMSIKEKAFQVTPDHFVAVIGGFIKTGEPHLAFRTHKLMQQCGFMQSSESIIHLATAFSQWQKLPMGYRMKREQRQLVGSALREFYKFYDIRKKGNKSNGIAAEPRHSNTSEDSASGLIQPRPESFEFGRMIYLFTQIRDFAKVRNLIELYRYVTTGNPSSTKLLPVELLDSIMLADFYDKKYDEVQASWNTMLQLAKEGAIAYWSQEMPDSDKVSPRFKYILNDGMKVMQNMLVEKGDKDGLVQLFDKVQAEGFQINSQNWNLYVQGLVKFREYQEAFMVCEQVLMSNWTGWAVVRPKEGLRTRLPLDVRRAGTRPRYLRPTSHTLFYLARAYVELNRLGPWSSDAAATLSGLEESAPRCYRAVKTMIRKHTDLENEILSGRGVLLSPAEEGYDDGEYEDFPETAGSPSEASGEGEAQGDDAPRIEESESK